MPDRRGHRRHPRLVGLARDTVAALAGAVQFLQELLDGFRRLRPTLPRLADPTLARHEFERFLVAQRREPRLPACGAMQRRLAPHVRVVAKAGLRALRLADKRDV